MTYIKHMEFVEVEDSISEPKKTFLQFVDVVDMVDKDGNPWDPTNPPDPDTYCTDLIKSVSLTSSQNWSDDISGSVATPENLFDGNLTTFAQHNAQNTPFMWTYGLLGTTSLRTYIQSGTADTTIQLVGLKGNQDVTVPANTNGWFDLPVTATGPTVNSIKFFNGGSGEYLQPSAIEINGAILVDSNASTVLTFPTAENFDLFKVGDVVQTSDDNSQVIAPYDSRANTDQVWSAGIAGNAGSTPPIQSFNGNTTNSVLAVSTTSALEWTPPATGYTKLEIKCREDGIAPQVGDGAITVSGTGITTTVIPGPQVSDTFVNIPLTGSPVGTLSFLGTLDKVTAGICEVKLDGRILVDKGFWNASQNWSSGGNNTNLADGGWEYVFDGALAPSATNAGVSPNQDTTVTWSGTISAIGKNVKVKYKADNVSIGSVTINGVTQPTVAGNYNTYQDLDFGTLGSDITSMSVTRGDVGSYGGIILSAVYVDGALLVDSGAQWDISQVWSVDNTAAVGFYYSSSGYYGGPENAFNGSLNNYCLAGTGVDTYDTGVYAPSSPIPFNTLKICVEQEGSGSLFVNTGSGLTDVTAELTMSGNKGVYTTSTPGTLTSLEYRSLGNGNFCALGSVEINGSILVNEGPNTSQLWSSGATTGSFYPGFPPSLSFDGNLATICGANTAGGFTLAMDVDITSTLRIYAGGTAGLLLLTVGGAVVSPAISSSAGWVDVPDVAGKKLTLINWTTGNPSLSAIEVDGRLLIDPSNIYSITDIDAAGPTINVDGGSWLGTDGSGEAGGQTKLCVTVTGPGPWDELVIAENGGANWVGSNVYEIGQTIEGKTAKFIGGLEPIIYRSRFQFQPAGGDTWVNKPWVDTTNDKNSMFYELTAPGKIKLQSQAKDSSEVAVYKPIYSNTSEKVVPYTEIGTVTVNPDQAAVNVMGNATFTAVVTGGDATDLTYKWTVRSGNAQLDTPDNQASATYTFIREGSTQIQCNVSSSNSSNSPQTNLSFVLVS